jgi:hypothetical protein
MHIRHFSYPLMTAVSALSLLVFAVAPARADDFGSRFTINAAPNLQIGTTSDQAAPPPAGNVGTGYTHDKPNPQDFLLDYGLDFRIDKFTHLSYQHANIDFALGRILTVAPHLSLVTGDIADHIDTATLSRFLGHGVGVSVYYFNHVRQDVTGLCLNQETCTAAQLGVGAKDGTVLGNPSSIDSHGYGGHAGYVFGPKTQIGQLFTVGVDAQYVPRPTTPPTGEAVNLGGLGNYVGSQWLFPYSINSKVPIFPSSTLIPVVGYERASVLWRAEATPEVYNVTFFTLVKVINKNATLSLTNLNFKGCRCADTVPPPDNVRFSQITLKLDLHTGL